MYLFILFWLLYLTIGLVLLYLFSRHNTLDLDTSTLCFDFSEDSCNQYLSGLGVLFLIMWPVCILWYLFDKVQHLSFWNYFNNGK